MVDSCSKDIRTLLLDSLLGIPFAIDWASGQFIYVGPQITDMLGYSPTDWNIVSDWSDCVHPDDSTCAMNYCMEQSQQGLSHEFEYRIIKKNGDIMWARDVVNVVKDENGKIQYLVGFIIDITQDKNIQNQIISDKDKFQKLTLVDHLTRIYNRRKFDSYFIEQWNSAIHSHEPLSLIITDIDYFKNYNDLYGHPTGDTALVRIGELLLETFKRKQDVVCRIGGEEFAVILPNTSLSTATELAKQLQQRLVESHIPHDKSPIADHITLSIGIGETTPKQELTSLDFYQFTDDLLYMAKRQGRNRVVAHIFSNAKADLAKIENAKKARA